MRVNIREQLAFLVLLTVLVALAVVSIPTWLYVNAHIAKNLREGLSLTASLKASRITSEVDLIETSAYTICSRLIVQDALSTLYRTNETDWDLATVDIQSALSAGSLNALLQARVYSRNLTGGGSTGGLLNVTSNTAPEIILPYAAPDGSRVTLSDTEFGYPPQLYPNITYIDLDRPNPVRPNESAFAAEAFPDVRIARDGGLLLGPIVINESTALLSVSVPIRDINDTFVLGYITVVALATSFIAVRDSQEGLDSSGLTLFLGPLSPWNRFNQSLAPANSTYTPDKKLLGEVPFHFVIPPSTLHDNADRHNVHDFSIGTTENTFPLKDYPAALNSNADRYNSVNNASALLSTHNEAGKAVAVGFARTRTPLVNWTIIVEKSEHEAREPIDTLRDILLGTVFGTAGLIALLIWPCAHLSVMPIRKLKHATERSISPPGYDESFIESDYEDESPGSGHISHRSTTKKGIMTTITRFMMGKPHKSTSARDAARRMFKIPGKVEDRKHYIQDELTELTSTFNDMSDELVKQYLSLDEKVALRTRELSESKKAAEAANESKTLFIANISHELKTPLNGIMGMCAICMEETDIDKIKASLSTLYKSGDLLLHLLEDLLSFSKNQIGQELTMEMREFRLADIRSQITTIFDKQVREGGIDFSVNFVGNTDVLEGLDSTPLAGSTSLPAYGPTGTGRLKDMCLWGDQHRILQVIINLVSNSLKFTPKGGKVEVRIKCLGEHDYGHDDMSRTSSLSKNSRSARGRYRNGSTGAQSANSSAKGSLQQYPQQGGTALAINPKDPKLAPHIHLREGSPAPPPPNARPYTFEFEVEDTGPGIPEHMQDKVFEPFVQADLGLSRKFGGTGLGLSICHQLAGLMGGHIGLRSVVDEGTTFTMQIPLKYTKDRPSSVLSGNSGPTVMGSDGIEGGYSNSAAAPIAPKPADSIHSQPRLVGLRQPFFPGDMPSPKAVDNNMTKLTTRESGPRLRVLVADDNPTNVEVVSRMLKLEAVHDVTVAKDGQEAYELVKLNMEENNFDLIFMDVQMPNVDGLQSTRLIRGIGYSSPIVALTAFSEESNVRDCLASGMNEFLSKPIRRPALKQVLKRFATIHEEAETNSIATRKTSTAEPSPNEKKQEPMLSEKDKLPEVVQSEKGEHQDANTTKKTNGLLHPNEASLNEKVG